MLQKNKVLLAIRTNKFDFQTLALYSYYVSQDIDVILCIDETSAQVNSGTIEKVSITNDSLKKLGLYLKIPGYLWLSGDLFLYAIYNQYPNYNGYWLIEDDAIIIKDDLKEFLIQPYNKKSDFSALLMKDAVKTWPWYESIYSLCKPETISACSFGVIYISNKLCQKAFEKRKELVKLYSQNDQENRYPNDESFLMNFFKKDEFNYIRIEDLYQNNSLFNNYKFSSFGEIYYFDHSFSNKTEGIYHPIIINQNCSDQIIREINIRNKQKKETLSVIIEKEDEVKSNLAKIKKVFFAIILYNIDLNIDYNNIFKNIQIFVIPTNYSKNDFYDSIYNIINNNSKFQSFFIINANKKIKKRSYLKDFNYITHIENQSMLYINKDLTINHDFIYITQEYKEKLNKITPQNFKNHKFLNNYFNINDIFE